MSETRTAADEQPAIGYALHYDEPVKITEVGGEPNGHQWVHYNGIKTPYIGSSSGNNIWRGFKPLDNGEQLELHHKTLRMQARLRQVRKEIRKLRHERSYIKSFLAKQDHPDAKP